MRKFLFILLLIVGNLSAQQKPEVQIDTAAIAKATFAHDLKKQYNTTDYIYEARAQQKNIWDRFLEWIAAWFRDFFNIANTETSIKIVKYIFKTIEVLIVLLMIYLIAKAILQKEGRWIFGKNTTQKLIDYDSVEKNLQATDFQKLIAETMISGNHRLAIRYYYLWLLQRLADKGIIQWDLEKTNSDYLHEIDNDNLRDNFSYLSYLYNYIWYGEFHIDESTFTKARIAFENAINSAR